MAERKPKKKEPAPVKKPRARRQKAEPVKVETLIESFSDKTPDTPQFGVWLVIAAVAALIIAVVVS
jgi:hypothetical protein